MEQRLIDGNNVRAVLLNIKNSLDGSPPNSVDMRAVLLAVADIIEAHPTIEAAPVVHGAWVNLGFIGDKEMVGCPVCHSVSETKSAFCKDCGAMMDLEALP